MRARILRTFREGTVVVLGTIYVAVVVLDSLIAYPILLVPKLIDRDLTAEVVNEWLDAIYGDN